MHKSFKKAGTEIICQSFNLLNEVGSLFLAFWNTCTASWQKKFTFAISPPDEFLVCILLGWRWCMN